METGLYECVVDHISVTTILCYASLLPAGVTRELHVAHLDAFLVLV